MLIEDLVAHETYLIDHANHKAPAKVPRGPWDRRQLLHVQHEEVRLPDDRLLHGADAEPIHITRNVVKYFNSSS